MAHYIDSSDEGNMDMDEDMDVTPSTSRRMTRGRLLYDPNVQGGIMKTANFDSIKSPTWMPFDIGTFDDPFTERVCTILSH